MPTQMPAESPLSPLSSGLRPTEFAGGSALGSKRVGFRLVLGASQLRLVACRPPPNRGTASKDSPDPTGLSFLPNESVPSSLHRHHLPLFDFADGLFADGECLLRPPFSAVPADRLRTISNASSGVWTDPRMAFSTRSSERAN
jgi:hypothetical protein